MTKEEIITKDLNMISKNIKDALFDAYEQGVIDGFDNGRKYGSEGIEQIQWERDAAIAQLKELGVEFGENAESFPKWHMTSEGDLPSDDHEVLAYCKWSDTCNYYVATYSSDVDTWFETFECYEHLPVVAWMELPKFSEVRNGRN